MTYVRYASTIFQLGAPRHLRGRLLLAHERLQLAEADLVRRQPAAEHVVRVLAAEGVVLVEVIVLRFARDDAAGAQVLLGEDVGEEVVQIAAVMVVALTCPFFWYWPPRPIATMSCDP